MTLSLTRREQQVLLGACGGASLALGGVLIGMAAAMDLSAGFYIAGLGAGAVGLTSVAGAATHLRGDDSRMRRRDRT